MKKYMCLGFPQNPCFIMLQYAFALFVTSIAYRFKSLACFQLVRRKTTEQKRKKKSPN